MESWKPGWVVIPVILKLLELCNYLQKYTNYRNRITSKVWRNLTISTQGASECFFFIFIRLKIEFEGKLDLVFVMKIFEFTKKIFEFTKSLTLAII